MYLKSKEWFDVLSMNGNFAMNYLAASCEVSKAHHANDSDSVTCGE